MEISGYWDGVTLGDAANAPYSSAEYARVQRDILRASKADSGPLLGSGVSPDPGLSVIATTPATTAINVTAGSALVRGTWYASDASVAFVIAANASGNPRIDTVVLRKNVVTQEVRLAVLAGIPAATPVPLPLTQIDITIWEIPIADIAVANGFATITQANITPRRHWANVADGCYHNDVLNNSGVTLETGDVVVWDLTADRAAKTTTTLGDVNTAGVWVGRTAAGGYGRILFKGIGFVRTFNGAPSRGAVLMSYSTDKLSFAIAPGTSYQSYRNAIGIALQSLIGAGLCLAYVDVGSQRDGAIAGHISTNAAASTSAPFVDTHANHAVTITPHGTRVRITCTFMGYISDAAKVGYFDIYSDGLAARAGDATYGLARTKSIVQIPVTIVGIFTGLTPGVAQTFRLQYATGDAGCTVNVQLPVVLWAEEI